jgi:hypothetical protein
MLMKPFPRSKRLFVVVGAIAGTALVGGIVYATIPDASGVIHGCVGGGGKLRTIDTDAGETCHGGETPLNWNQQGPQGIQGPQGLQGPQGAQGPAGVNQVFMNRNFQQVPLAPFPGVTVATLSLGPGTYIVTAKFRYQGTGSMTQTASCAYQGVGIGGLDASQHNVPPGGEADGQVDGYMMDFVRKQVGDDPDVHVQCFGPADVKIINTQLVALPTTINLQPEGFPL